MVCDSGRITACCHFPLFEVISMSQGDTVIRVYEGDSAETHFVRQQPESAVFSIDGTANAIPAGPPSSPFWAKSTRKAKEYGLRPRKLRGRWTSGSQPTGYSDCAEFEVVVYTKAIYDAAVIGSPCTYLGAPGVLIGRVPEDIYPVT